MQIDLTGQVALVTGASRGIGAAIADRLAGCGATVIGTATSEGGAQAISERFAALGEAQKAISELTVRVGAGSEGRVLDVNDGDAVDALVAELGAAPGAPTILVNNAGITRDQLLMRMKDEDWAAVMDTNLRSVFRLSKACLRGMMRAKGGRIVSIASVVGSIGNPGQSNYAAAKAGMMGFSRALAREVGSRGITVNVVAPGFIDTDMTRALDEKQREALMRDIPLGRLGAAEEIAAAVAFLASPDAGYITGQTLHVNGGMFMS